MEWCELWSAEHEPTEKQITEFVGSPLWDELTHYLQETYNIRAKLSYSRCSMDKGAWKGWNVKYKKSGRALCTLYPKQGHFIALLNIGAKERSEADRLIPLCDKYTRELYNRTEAGNLGKSLPMDVTNKKRMRDVKNLVALRAGSR